MGCWVVTEPDPLAFAAFAASHGGNKHRVLQAAAGEERQPCPGQRRGAEQGGCAPTLHSSGRAGGGLDCEDGRGSSARCRAR